MTSSTFESRMQGSPPSVFSLDVILLSLDKIKKTIDRHIKLRVLARAKSKGGGGDKRKSSIYNSLVDLNV